MDTPAAPLTHIRPPAGWPLPDPRPLWAYRDLVALLAWRDIAVRYRQTLLGVAWAVLQPALMMAAFTAFLGRVAGPPADGTPYPLFVLAGLVAWTFFAHTMQEAARSVIGSERLIGKVYFPRLAVPVAATAAPAVDLLVGCGLLAALSVGWAVAGSHAPPGPQVLLAPVAVVALLAMALGVGSALAATSVRYRDVRVVVPFLVQFGLFATPAVYLPSAGGWLATLNPLNGLIATFRAAVLGGPVPWGPFLAGCGVAVLALVAGGMVFRRLEDDFADSI